MFKCKEETLFSKRMTKTEKFFKRLPFTTFFSPEFIGNALDKKLVENVSKQDMGAIKNSILNGAKVNARNEEGKTCLMIACEKGNFEIVSFLIKEYAKLDLRDDKGKTALHYACMQSNLRIISSILSKDLGKRKFRKRINRIDKEGNTPLNLAVQNNHYFIVNYLLLNKANKNIKNKEGKDAFDVAKKNDNVKIMVLLRNF